MAILVKDRVHEVAKDFKMNSKSIAEILTKYATAPKNHMQVLEEGELDIIFEYLTQKHQIASIEEIYTVEPPAEKKSEKPSAAAEGKGDEAGKNQDGSTAAEESPAKQPEKAHQPKAVPQKRIIDTSGVTINIDKYDERLDSLVPESPHNMKRGKEKFTKKSQARGQNMAASIKRRQEERDKMQKLQLEIAKKAPLKGQKPAVPLTHTRAHETDSHLGCRLLL